jgi:transketolase
MDKKMDELCVNTIVTLAMDAVQQANSGHPGTPMALAPVVSRGFAIAAFVNDEFEAGWE